MLTRVLKFFKPLYSFGLDHPRVAKIMFSILSVIYWIIDRYYRRQSTQYTTRLDNQPKLLLITIAFNNPALIEKQIELINRFAEPGTVLLIADNSTDISHRQTIKAVCETKDVAYISLPKNPWQQANLSHGITLNWIYYNVVKKVKPFSFGFLDHDIFPVSAIKILEQLKNTPLYGLKQSRQNAEFSAWYLWAGFCFFRFDYMKTKFIDFNPQVLATWHSYLGLDTGGANYKVLYKETPLAEVTFAQSSYLENGSEKIDNWVHISKSSFRTPE
jgi:hypothetical protein